MPKTKTRPYDAAEYLQDDDDVTAYLEAALEDGDPDVVLHALRNIARARGIPRIAREAGMKFETLSKALSPKGRPEFTTVLKMVRALGIRLHAEPVSS